MWRVALLVLTHLLALAVGLVVGYLYTLASRGESPRLPQRKEHAVDKSKRPVSRLALVSIASSLFVTAIGAQAYLAQQDNKERDHDDRVRQCQIDNSVKSLLDTLEERAAATSRLNAAKDARANASDAVILVVVNANASKQPLSKDDEAKFTKDFTKALNNFAKAKRELVKVDEETKPILDTPGPKFKLQTTAKGCPSD